MIEEQGSSLTDAESYGRSLRGHAEAPTDSSVKSLDTVAIIVSFIMALGPLTVFAIFRGAGYSL